MSLFSTPEQKAEKLYQAALKKGGGDNFYKAAEMGHPRAQMMYGLSLFYRHGERVQALEYLEKAALQGCVGGLIGELGYTPEELGPFLAKWVRAAEQGDCWAGYLCAEMRCQGYEIPFKDDRLFAWCREAAQSGQREPKFLCGWMLEQGIGTEADPLKALALYEEAAGQGFFMAMFRAGELYRVGALGLPADKAKAQALFEQAAEKNKAPSVLGACAKMYLPDGGDSQSLEKAVELYKEVFRRLGADDSPYKDIDLETSPLLLGVGLFNLGQTELALPLLEYAASQRYTAAMLLVAALRRWEMLGGIQPGLPFWASRFHQTNPVGNWFRADVLYFDECLHSFKPGDRVLFGRYPQEKEPGAYRRGALPEPLTWDVLEVRDGRILLLSAWGLAYSRDKVCDISFSPAEQTLVREVPFHLSDAEYQDYVMEKHLADFDAPVTMHAMMEVILEKNRNYELHKNPDGSIHKISYREWEWEAGWQRILKRRHPPEWALRDCPAGEYSVSRPAVWLGLK